MIAVTSFIRCPTVFATLPDGTFDAKGRTPLVILDAMDEGEKPRGLQSEEKRIRENPIA